jgi:hypothetical protein
MGEMMNKTMRALLAASAAGLASCALLVQFNNECTSDADCTSKGANLHCTQNLCVASSGATDGSVGLDGSTGGTDASCPVPVTYTDFLNGPCTNAACVPFDDSRVTLKYPDGALPPVPDIPDSGVIGGAG